MLKFGIGEVIIILLVLLLLFGAKRLPEMGRALGKAIREFRKAGKDIENEVEDPDQKTEDEKTG